MTELELRADYHDIVEVRAFPTTGIELREVPNGTGGTALNFQGYASRTETPYPMFDMFGEYTETIKTGAFGRTLKDGPDVAFLINHSGMTMARTKAGSLDLAEDGIGLDSQARFNPGRDEVRNLRMAVDDGDLDQMSFAFRVYSGGNDWNEEYTERGITAVNLHRGDVSAVNFGANEMSNIGSLRHARGAGEVTERLWQPVLAAIRSDVESGVPVDDATRALVESIHSLLAAPIQEAAEKVADVVELTDARPVRSLKFYEAQALALRLAAK